MKREQEYHHDPTAERLAKAERRRGGKTDFSG